MHDEIISLHYWASSEQVAYIFTKELSEKTFNNLKSLLDVVFSSLLEGPRDRFSSFYSAQQRLRYRPNREELSQQYLQCRCRLTQYISVLWVTSRTMFPQFVWKGVLVPWLYTKVFPTKTGKMGDLYAQYFNTYLWSNPSLLHLCELISQYVTIK